MVLVTVSKRKARQFSSDVLVFGDNAISLSLRNIYRLISVYAAWTLVSTNFSLAEDFNTIRCVEDNCKSCELVFFKRDQAWFDKKLMPMIGDVSDNWRTINDDKNVLAIDLIKWLDGFFSHSVFWLDRERLRFHWAKVLIETDSEIHHEAIFLESSGTCAVGG